MTNSADTTTARRPRILVVEDMMLIALDFIDQLSDLGYDVVGPASSLRQGLAFAAAESPLDGALLDINLAGEFCYPIAQMLQSRGVPFVFITGELTRSIPREFQDTPVLMKPADSGQIRNALRSFARRRSSPPQPSGRGTHRESADSGYNAYPFDAMTSPSRT